MIAKPRIHSSEGKLAATKSFIINAPQSGQVMSAAALLARNPEPSDTDVREWLGVAIDEVDRAHDHARGAETALQAMVLTERRLHRMQLAIAGEAFDGGDVGTLGLHREHSAGLHRNTADMHDTSAALAGVTTDMRPGKADMFA